MITEIPGVHVGHWTDVAAATGCTVVLFPDGVAASGEVRGGAPATREVALLDPTRTVQRIDAVVLTGGSAFGLAAADGVMRFCGERGMGVGTPGGVVPIVVALGLYDLATGDPSVRPGPDEGYAACAAASPGPYEVGRVGAGTGTTVGSGVWRDLSVRRPGGLVTATATAGALRVAAIVAVNAFGVPGAADDTGPEAASALRGPALFGNTTIGVVATNARLDKLGCHAVAQAAHDGLARAVFPAHTQGDGDAFVAAATGEIEAAVDAARTLAVHAVAEAIRSLAATAG